MCWKYHRELMFSSASVYSLLVALKHQWRFRKRNECMCTCESTSEIEKRCPRADNSLQLREAQAAHTASSGSHWVTGYIQKRKYTQATKLKCLALLRNFRVRSGFVFGLDMTSKIDSLRWIKGLCDSCYVKHFHTTPSFWDINIIKQMTMLVVLQEKCVFV